MKKERTYLNTLLAAIVSFIRFLTCKVFRKISLTLLVRNLGSSKVQSMNFFIRRGNMEIL